MATTFEETVAATFYDMLARVQVDYPDARLSLSDDRWHLVIDTGVGEAFTLSERFRGTPAWEMLASYEGGESSLHRWAWNNGYSSLPLDIVAEYFNLRSEEERLQREWLDQKIIELGLRPFDEMLDDPDSITEEERSNL